MKQCDLRPGNRIKNGGVIFEIAQCNLFLRPTGRLMGGAVFPVRMGQRIGLVRGYCARAVASNGRLTRQRLTVE